MLAAVTAVPAAETEDSRDTAGPATEIVRRMIAAAGGMERWNSVRDATFSVRHLAYGSEGGKPLVTVNHIAFTKDPRPMLRVEIPFRKSTQVKVFDGTEAWVVVDGLLLHRSAETYGRIRDAAKDMVFWLTLPFNLVHPSTQVEHLGRSRFMGVEVDVIQVSFRDDTLATHADDRYRFSVDKLTHLVVREEYFLHGDPDARMETLYGDYRAVNGIVKDHVREIVTSPEGERLHRVEVEVLRFGVTLPPTLFRKPADPMAAETPSE